MDRPWRSSRNAPASNVGYGESLIGETQDSATAKAKGNAFERYSYVSRQSEGPPAELTLRGPQEELLSLAREKMAQWQSKSDAGGSLDHVLAMFRKLREGLTASRSMDAFTITVYEESVDACLEAENYAELHKSLSHLLQDVYPNCIKGDPVNDVVKRRDEMAAYYLLYRICYAKASSQKTLYGPPQEILSFLSSLPLDIRKSSRVQGAVRVWESLVLDVDYVSLARQWKDASLQEKRLIKCILPTARRRILEILKKAYFMLPMDRCLDWLILDSPEDLQALLTLVFGPNGDWSIAEDKSIVTLRVPKKKQ